MKRFWPPIFVLACLPLLACCTHTPSAQDVFGEGVRAFDRHDYLNAENRLQQCVKMWQSTPDGSEHLADAWLYLSRVFGEEGKYQSAEDALTAAVKLLSAKYGADSRPVALALLKLSACHHKQGEYAEAAPICQRALAIEEKILPPQDLLLAATSNNLAETYEKLSNTDKAEQLFKRAIAIYRVHIDSDEGKQGLLETLENLALFYKQTNRIPLAITTAKAALAISHGRSGAALNGRAAALNTLATIERADFDQQTAAQDYQKALKLLDRSSKQDQDLISDVSDNYANMLLEEKDFDKAEQLLKQSIDCERERHGKIHPHVAKRLKELAALYKEEGRMTEAESLLVQALAIDKIAFQSDSPITMETMNNLSAVLVSEHKFTAAESVYADWLPTLVKVLGPDHPHVADALDNWALVAEKAKDSDRAARLRARAKQIRLKSERPLATKSDCNWCLKAFAAPAWLSA